MSFETYREKYMRICRFCGEEKPIEDFANDAECKQCRVKRRS